MGQAVKFKRGTALILLIFLIYVAIYGEEELSSLEQKYENYEGDQEIKHLLRQKAMKEYNFERLEKFQEKIGIAYESRAKYYKDFENLRSLQQTERKALWFLLADHTWELINEAFFNLMDENEDQQIDQSEFDNFMQIFCNYNSKYLKRVKGIFKKISKGSSSFKLQALKNYLNDFKDILETELKQKNKENSRRNLKGKKSENEFTDNARDLLDIVEQGIKLQLSLNLKQAEQIDSPKFLFFSKNYTHWQIVAETIFKIIDRNQDNLLCQQEMGIFLTNFKFSREIQDFFMEEFDQLNQNIESSLFQTQQQQQNNNNTNTNTNNTNNNYYTPDAYQQGQQYQQQNQQQPPQQQQQQQQSQTHQCEGSTSDDFTVNLDEFDAFSERLYQLYMNYNGVDLKENDQFSFYYYSYKEVQHP